MGLMLAVNVAVGIADVDLAKLSEGIDAGAVSGPEIRTAEFPIADIAREQRTAKIVGGILQRLQKCTVARRHVITHLL